jgi:DNA-binding NtrC family response regulator
MASILVVDDDRNTRLLMSQILERTGHQVFDAANGEDALNVLSRSGPPDLVITDVLMPDMDGLTLLKTLQAHYPTIRIILVSAHTQSGWMLESLKEGAILCLTKPFSHKQLLTMVEDVLHIKSNDT